MDHQTAMAKLEQFKNERVPLEASYAYLTADMTTLAQSVEGRVERPTLPPEITQLILRLGNTIELEREQVATLFSLLMDASDLLPGVLLSRAPTRPLLSQRP